MSLNSEFVVTRAKPEAGSRLFCFPHAGGGPVAFYDWSERLGAEIEVVCLQYAGRGARLREKPCTSVEGLVEEIAGGFEEFRDKPFTFYGHSFGGIVAFELARWMRSAGLPGPLHLIVGATRAPQLPSPYTPIAELPDGEFVESVQTRYGGIPAAIYRDPEVLEMFLPAMRADFLAYEAYRFRQEDPLEIPITAFGGREDPAVQLESLEEWALHTVAGFDINVLPGGHFFPTVSASELIAALQIRIEAQLGERKSTFIR